MNQDIDIENLPFDQQKEQGILHQSFKERIKKKRKKMIVAQAPLQKKEMK